MVSDFIIGKWPVNPQYKDIQYMTAVGSPRCSYNDSTAMSVIVYLVFKLSSIFYFIFFTFLSWIHSYVCFTTCSTKFVAQSRFIMRCYAILTKACFQSEIRIFHGNSNNIRNKGRLSVYTNHELTNSMKKYDMKPQTAACRWASCAVHRNKTSQPQPLKLCRNAKCKNHMQF